MALFFGFILWIFFGALFFFILYHVIYAAINAANKDSELLRDVREIKELLASRLAESSAQTQAGPPIDPSLTEICPGCGNRVHPQDTRCPECELLLR